MIGRPIKVKLDCEAKYLAEEDPWGIGAADSARYDLYVEAIRTHARARGSVLDVGCGFGAMLARLQHDFERLHGIELSAEAIAKGSRRHPFIAFERGSIDALERVEADGERFDAIVFSDVLYYVDEAGRRASLRWIAEHLHSDGLALIAAYSPGGREYPTPEELCTLVEREFVIERRELLESEHLVLLARPRRRLAALTLDYETWQPVPAGRRIDWDADVFEPTDALLDACDAEGARLTIFAELGEHAFLREHEPRIAGRMEAQWRDAIQRGHDVQLHLHPNWLPELGARLRDGRYVWNERLTRAEDHPDLVRLVARLKRTLEQAIRPVDPTYRAVAFRAGGYEAQPFRRLAEALCANDVWCDSSVYHGGRRPGVYHDYSWPFDLHQPWFASHADPQLQAPPAERGIVELPVATFARHDRWTFDSSEGRLFGERLLAAIEAERTAGPSTETARRIAKARQLLGMAYDKTRSHRRAVDRVLPRALAHALVDDPPPRRLDDDFYVAVGHSKADLETPAIREQLRLLREGGVEVVRLSELAALAREQLERRVAPDAESDARRQDRRERTAVLAAERDDAQPRRLRSAIPLDRTRILDLGCVAVAELLALPFADGAFDCVYADNALELAFDVDATLAEARRVLGEGGVLVATIPPDAYDARRGVEDHAWRTSAADVRERLARAGFVDVAVEEADAYLRRAAPYPPAADRVLDVRAWRRAASQAPIERVDALRRWARARSDPRLLGEALAREGFAPRWVTMLAQEHPHGHGPRQECSREVIELTLPDRQIHVLDPLADVRFPCALHALLEDALLADGLARGDGALAPEHELYATSFWYRRVVAVAVRERPDQPLRFVPARWIESATDPRRQALAVFRLRGWRAVRRLRPA
ncbi:MAG TPA: methyltransferase domain-containing protein [Solirubrobacteraceae bacterium]|jgi:SAM-dependent methyltransferase|nr:methyltransferase domain-containing protein [Solirubrobacteraceae bacterium]